MKTDNNRNSTLIQIHCCKRILLLNGIKSLLPYKSRQLATTCICVRQAARFFCSLRPMGRRDCCCLARRLSSSSNARLLLCIRVLLYYYTGVFWGAQNCIEKRAKLSSSSMYITIRKIQKVEIKKKSHSTLRVKRATFSF